MPVTILVDSRLRLRLAELPPEVVTKLKQAFTHDNPSFHAASAMGLSTWNVPRVYTTWLTGFGELCLPRGGMKRLRAILTEAGLTWEIQDRRSRGKSVGAGRLPPTKMVLRDYQITMINAALGRENCLLRAGTGSGKTTVAIALASRIGLYTLIIVLEREPL